MKLARMRTLDECFAEIKAMDENTAISKCYIRRLINYLSCSGNTTETAPEYTPSNNIRPIY